MTEDNAPEAVQNFRISLIKKLGANNVITSSNDMLRFCRDWHGDVISDAVAVLCPRTSADVVQAVRACRELGLSIIPQGGNTGLVLGAIPERPDNQVILSLGKMNKIRNIDTDNFSAIVEAGCILSTMKDELGAKGMFFPLALGSQGSCQIGGNVSTNAGGINVLRYGMTRDLVLGLEVVLPDGTIFNGLSTLRKDNRGLDLKQLFIGAEGTLGIITAVSIKLMPQPEHVETALLALNSLQDVIALYRHARVKCCDLMSAFEFMPPIAFTLAHEAMPDLVMPLDTHYPAYVLMEISGSGLVNIAELMGAFLESAMESGLVRDGTIATSRAQAKNLWNIREGMNEGQALRGAHLRTDISVPLSRLADFVNESEAAITKDQPAALCVSYGHVGDGNVHLNILPPQNANVEERKAYIKQSKNIIYAVVDRYDGSISAEHGIGRMKRDDFEARISETQRSLLVAIKQAIDPVGLMNPNCQLRSPPVLGSNASML